MNSGFARLRSRPGMTPRSSVAILIICWHVSVMTTPPGHPPPSMLRQLLAHEASGGLILIASAGVALVVANSSAANLYETVLASKVAGLSVLHWINDALMALFFVLVGLEIKRELLDGHLSSWQHRILPGIAAAGGRKFASRSSKACKRVALQSERDDSVPDHIYNVLFLRTGIWPEQPMTKAG